MCSWLLSQAICSHMTYNQVFEKLWLFLKLYRGFQHQTIIPEAFFELVEVQFSVSIVIHDLENPGNKSVVKNYDHWCRVIKSKGWGRPPLGLICACGWDSLLSMRICAIAVPTFKNQPKWMSAFSLQTICSFQAMSCWKLSNRQQLRTYPQHLMYVGWLRTVNPSKIPWQARVESL